MVNDCYSCKGQLNRLVILVNRPSLHSGKLNASKNEMVSFMAKKGLSVKLIACLLKKNLHHGK